MIVPQVAFRRRESLVQRSNSYCYRRLRAGSCGRRRTLLRLPSAIVPLPPVRRSAVPCLPAARTALSDCWDCPPRWLLNDPKSPSLDAAHAHEKREPAEWLYTSALPSQSSLAPLLLPADQTAVLPAHLRAPKLRSLDCLPRRSLESSRRRYSDAS